MNRKLSTPDWNLQENRVVLFLAAFVARRPRAVPPKQLFPETDLFGYEGTLVVEALGGRVATTAPELGLAPGRFTTFSVAPLI